MGHGNDKVKSHMVEALLTKGVLVFQLPLFSFVRIRPTVFASTTLQFAFEQQLEIHHENCCIPKGG